MSTHSRSSFSAIAALFLICAAASGQVTTGTILGKVTDPTGAVVPSATVVIENEQTGRSYKGATGADGAYLFPLLPIGSSYALSVEASGFKKYVQKGIELRVNENVRVDLKLEVGAITQTVEITAAPPQVDTQSTTLGEVMDTKRVTELPLNGRNPIQLASLVAGVTSVSAPTVYAWRGGGYLSANGARANENDFLLDGAHYAGAYFNNGLNYPSPDALQEFKLITHTFSAEYGRNAGSVFNAVPKSGTNDIHGSVWEFLRNDALNARNFFLNTPGSKKSVLRQNQFGFTAGGPVVKNKVFWFGSYQGLRIRQQAIRTTFPPTAEERAGYFRTALKDPATGAAITPDSQGRYFIDPQRFDPITAKVMNDFMPLPGADGRLVIQGSAPSDNNHYLAKIDANISSKNILNVTGFIDRTTRQDPFWQSAFLNYSHLFNTNNSELVTLTDTHTFSPTLLNQFRLSYHGFLEDLSCPDQVSLRDMGAVSFFPDGPPQRPNLSASGRFNVGTSGICVLREKTISKQGANTLTWIRGRHNVKTGAEVHRLFNFTHAWYLEPGAFTFTGGITGNAVADYLVGIPSAYQRQNEGSSDSVSWEYSGFFQDDWKVTPRLTLNLGVRYAVQVPWVTNLTNGKYRDGKGAFRPGQRSGRYPTAPVGLVYVGDPGIPRTLYPIDRNNWEPRLGLAYDVFGNGKTSLRLAYGWFHDLAYPDISAQSGSNQPWVYREVFNSMPGGVSDPYRGKVNPWPFRVSDNPSYVLPAFISSIPADFRQPLIQQWTFNVQQQVTGNFMLDAAYAGSQAVGLEMTIQSNPPVYKPGTDASGAPLSTLANADSRRIYAPVFGQIRDVQSIGRSVFHSLQLTGRYRYWHGLLFNAAYTWSKSIDTISVYQAANFPQDPFNSLRGDRGPSDFDLTHVFALSWVYDVPTLSGVHPVLKAVIGNWEMSGLTRLTSGTPFSIMSGINNSLNGENRDRANVVGNPWDISNSRPRGERILQWFNTAAFVVNPVGSVGNSSRNMMRGPAQLNTDFAAMKNFPISDRWGRFQFRSEFFNFLNQVRFGNPNNTRVSAAFGRVTSAADPRLVQFSLKYIF